MKINSSAHLNYNQTSHRKTTIEVKETSFSSMLSTQNDTTIEKKEGLFVTFMDEHNLFDSLSIENKKVFREILMDDEITMSEMDSLSYEQSSLLLDYAIPAKFLSKEDFGKTPIVSMTQQISSMLFAPRTTNDDAFNEALFRMAREIDNDLERDNILNDVNNTLSQALNPDSPSYNLWNWDYDTMNINFSNFLFDVSNLTAESINDTQDEEVRERQQKILDGYEIISKHYFEIKDGVMGQLSD